MEEAIAAKVFSPAFLDELQAILAAHVPAGYVGGKQEDWMPLKPFELREMTPEEREERDLAIKQAKESEKADAAKKAVKLRPMPARKK